MIENGYSVARPNVSGAPPLPSAAGPRRRRADRVGARPDPSQWRDDELVTLAEAARLYWPNGPLTVRTLRTAVRDGKLAVTRVAGKLFTCPSALREMSRCATVAPSEDRPLAAPRRMTQAEARAFLAGHGLPAAPMPGH